MRVIQDNPKKSKWTVSYYRQAVRRYSREKAFIEFNPNLATAPVNNTITEYYGPIVITKFWERPNFIFEATLNYSRTSRGWVYMTDLEDPLLEFPISQKPFHEFMQALTAGRIQVINGSFVGRFTFFNSTGNCVIRPYTN